MSRTLCLGAGAMTGAAWQLGVLAGLADEGVRLADADQIIGTSAGALIGAHLALGRAADDIADLLPTLDEQPLNPATLARLGLAQVWPSRRYAVMWLGRAATGGSWTPAAGQEWVSTLSVGLAENPWPAGLVIVAMDAGTGRPAWFTAGSNVALEVAVAASCALPGAFPPVMIAGRAHFDGALRSPVNLDLADDAEAVVAVVPYAASARPNRRPQQQARRLCGRVILLEPDRPSRRAMGLDPMSSARAAAAMAAGRDFGQRAAQRVQAVW